MAVAATRTRDGAAPEWAITRGGTEFLKWSGLVCMTADHFNKYLFNGTLPWLFEIGRLALPLFVAVLAINLAQAGKNDPGVYTRTMKRLAFFGAIASVPFIGLGGLVAGWWPLNVMFTLLVLTATLYYLQQGNGPLAVLIGVVGGGMVEFCWPAILLGVCLWEYARKPSWNFALAAIIACATLWFVNGTFWALTALPLIALMPRLALPIPRLKWLFYAYYPLHVAALWFIRIPMAKAGYLFF